ncbi:heavy metal translocating P-type ATPase [Enterococcus dispar]|uniref:heavy metal translocating P-type ATPase n=1 Tax=Enterococcus dispar TaxID=44009 RepID=UPI0021D4547B|nr:heavy metal translocating P-type ATPase [Enterococcus dispar]MCU7357860.1 heavy metal translocating P-type ATPase [Enterococcus dispar]MDT2706128.1 heavy metal translocating P-type ATPase [Enterococcus dispar]
MKYQQLILRHKNTIALISGGLIIIAFINKLSHFTAGYTGAMVVASILGGAPIFIQAYQALRVKVVSIDLLVTIAVIGAFLIGEFNESAMVTFLFLFGSLLEQKTLEKTRSAIKTLAQMAPTTAFVIRAGEIEEIDVAKVDVLDHLLVKTGGQVPVDGVIKAGDGYLNEASVTGESEIVHKVEGDFVFAGTLLDNGTLEIEAQKVGEDTTFGKIIELVEEAQDSKSTAERFVDRFAKFYTPLVLILALVAGLVSRNLSLAITILVLGCPGALVIGVPVSNVAAIGNGAKFGILLKGGEVLDNFSKVDTFVFDKTGTLTTGKPTVAALQNYRGDREENLRILASVEKESDHPLGHAILGYAAVEKYLSVEKTEVVKGSGIRAVIGSHEVLIGNEKLLQEAGINIKKALQDQIRLQENGHSLVYLAVDGKLAQLVGVKDQIRPQVKETLVQLKKMGIKNFIMLTGDNEKTAAIVGASLEITEIHGELLPADKAEFITKLQKSGHKVAFVGDGVNDSPSIALADIGIAMGNGTDVAVETSDVVLMNSDFTKLVHAFALTKKTVGNMKENITLAVGTVIFLLVGLIFGYIYMASGMLVHELSILVVILNGMRLLPFKVGKLDNYQVLNSKEVLQ